MNIGIMGVAVEAGNRGVRALGSSLVSLCENAQGGATVRFLASHRRRETIELGPRNGGRKEIEVVNCRLSPKAKPTEHLVWIVLACLVYRLVPFRGLRSGLSRLIPWIRAMEEADILGDIRGGDSFSDIYGLGRFLRGFSLRGPLS
jgi:colanic acid/amylovoran biosynthesis protein